MQLIQSRWWPGDLYRWTSFSPSGSLTMLSGSLREDAAVDVEGALAAGEDAAAGAAVGHDDAVGIDVLHAVRGLGIVGRDDLDGAGFIHAEAPLGDVVVVRAHVGVAAAGVFAIVAPGGEVIVHAPGAEHRVVRPHGRGAEPEVPVEAGLHLLGGQVAPAARAAHADGDGLDLAQPAAADDFRRLAELAEHVGTLLAAGLEDALVFARRVDAALGLRRASGSAASRSKRPCRPSSPRWPGSRASARAWRCRRRRCPCGRSARGSRRTSSQPLYEVLSE